MDLLDYSQNLGLAPQKVSTANGGEYASACPGCGDGGKGRKSDRFHIWPDMENKGLCNGRFWCRQCDAKGDTIEFLQKYHGMSFPEACAELGIALPNRGVAAPKKHFKTASLPAAPEGWSPRDYGTPTAQWQEKAGNLLADCTARLGNVPEAMAWLETRGISREIATRYRLGYNQSRKDGDRYRPRTAWGLSPKPGRGGKQVASLWIPRGWVIPAFDVHGALVQLRVRRENDDIKKFCGNIKYLPLDGSCIATLIVCPEAEVFVPVECGFDAYLVAGAMHGKVGAICTWNDSARPDVHAHRTLSRASLILNGLDFDKAGEHQQTWWNATYKNNQRLTQPGAGIKDPGEAAAAGVSITEWIVDALPRGLRIALGFEKTQKIQRQDSPVPAHISEPPPPEETKEPPPAAPATQGVVEVELSNGTVIYLTDDRQEWDRLTGEGLPVFSREEMESLKTATATMAPAERLAAAMQAIEVKKIFSGYISDGRVVEPVKEETSAREG